jgi:hypothetical protein
MHSTIGAGTHIYRIFIGSVGNRLEPLEPRVASPLISGDSLVPVSDAETGTTLEPAASCGPCTAALFVSTGLESWNTDRPNVFARDVQIDDTAYRRLDPEYYAWLRSKMNLAKMAADAGQLGRDEFDELRRRFNAMHDWAVAHFGEPALIDAISNLDARDYAPSVPEPDRPRRNPQPAAVATETVLAMVGAIAEPAMALGWNRDSLYRTSGGAFGFHCGLAHFLKPSDRIGEVTTHWIEIVRAGDVRQRFYNSSVDQPWIRRTNSGAE